MILLTLMSIQEMEIYRKKSQLILGHLIKEKKQRKGEGHLFHNILLLTSGGYTGGLPLLSPGFCGILANTICSAHKLKGD